MLVPCEGGSQGLQPSTHCTSIRVPHQSNCLPHIVGSGLHPSTPMRKGRAAAAADHIMKWSITMRKSAGFCAL